MTCGELSTVLHKRHTDCSRAFWLNDSFWNIFDSSSGGQSAKEAVPAAGSAL